MDFELLEEVIKTENIKKLKKIISSGFYINQILTDLPPLSLALNCKHWKIAELLINSGADVCHTDASGKFLPMFYAIKNQCPNFIINKLISAGAPKDGIVEFNCNGTALHLAVYANNKCTLKCLINLSVDLNVKDISGMTPLHVAVQQNHPKIIKLLIRNGAAIDEENNDKFTPLMYAIHNNEIAIVKLLISLGSNVNHEPREPKYSYQRPLNYASGLGHNKIVETLLQNGADVKLTSASGDSALHSLAFSYRMNGPSTKPVVHAVIDTLCEYKADLESCNSLGFTCLQVAIIMMNSAVAKYLIEISNGLSNITESRNQSLRIAARVGDAAIVKLLLDSGADPDSRDANGLSPYDMALMQDDTATVKTFWQYYYPYDCSKRITLENNRIRGEEIDNKILSLLEQQRLFMEGIETGNINVVEKALENEAEPRGCGMKIKNTLHFAITHGMLDIACLLIKKGVPTGTVDENGETPLHLAARMGHLTVCKMLLIYGACYNYSNRAGRTPIKEAREHGHKPVIKLLSQVHRSFQDFLKDGDVKNIEKRTKELFRKDESLALCVTHCVDRRGINIIYKYT